MTHAEIAAHCLEPIRDHIATFGHKPNKTAVTSASAAGALSECHTRIAQALADQRRDQLQAQADMLCDATPHGAKGTTA